MWKVSESGDDSIFALLVSWCDKTHNPDRFQWHSHINCSVTVRYQSISHHWAAPPKNYGENVVSTTALY